MKSVSMIALFLCVVMGCDIRADEAQEARQVVKTAVDEVLGVLKNSASESAEVRDEKVNAVVRRVFDTSLMAKLVLGREYWPRLSDEQKTEFETLFVKQLQNSYLGKASMFTERDVVVGDAVGQGGKMTVKSEVSSGAEHISLLYKLHRERETGEWKIYDVEINDVSIIASHRTEYGDILARNSVDEFLERMRNKVTETENTPQ